MTKWDRFWDTVLPLSFIAAVGLAVFVMGYGCSAIRAKNAECETLGATVDGMKCVRCTEVKGPK